MAIGGETTWRWRVTPTIDELLSQLHKVLSVEMSCIGVPWLDGEIIGLIGHPEGVSVPGETFHRPSVFGRSQFGAQPGCMLEDAFRAGVMKKLVAADKALLHGDFAPGTLAVRKVCQCILNGCRHRGHCLRGL